MVVLGAGLVALPGALCDRYEDELRSHSISPKNKTVHLLNVKTGSETFGLLFPGSPT